jgi:hypothetical protein
MSQKESNKMFLINLLRDLPRPEKVILSLVSILSLFL